MKIRNQDDPLPQTSADDGGDEQLCFLGDLTFKDGDTYCHPDTNTVWVCSGGQMQDTARACVPEGRNNRDAKATREDYEEFRQFLQFRRFREYEEFREWLAFKRQRAADHC
ncbi:MAG: hypothetical protein KDE27_07755 [Planctomycetes bacterium]|nr:hypothetical protein [Planctomycetota bacterium]